jgi:hypothetical protein
MACWRYFRTISLQSLVLAACLMDLRRMPACMLAPILHKANQKTMPRLNPAIFALQKGAQEVKDLNF